MKGAAPERSFTSYALTGAGAAACGLLAAAAVRGWSYYVLPLSERALHPAHEALRSSGAYGLPLGVAGYGLIVLNLGYLVRRSFVKWEWMGTLRDWMSMHVFTGVVGCGMILLHSAFQPRSPMGSLAFWSLLIVLLTGLVGRYIYAHIPRTMQGRELELEDLRRQLEERRAALAARGVGLEAPAGAAEGAPAQGLAAALGAMIAGDREAAREYARLRAAVLASPELKAAAGEILPLARRYVLETRWLSYSRELREVMAGWRFFHRWFAIVMIVFALAHVLIATRIGGLDAGLP